MKLLCVLAIVLQSWRSHGLHTFCSPATKSTSHPACCAQRWQLSPGCLRQAFKHYRQKSPQYQPTACVASKQHPFCQSAQRKVYYKCTYVFCLCQWLQAKRVYHCELSSGLVDWHCLAADLTSSHMYVLCMLNNSSCMMPVLGMCSKTMAGIFQGNGCCSAHAALLEHTSCQYRFP